MDSNTIFLIGGASLYTANTRDVEIIHAIDENDTNPYVITTYRVKDYASRRYPPSKMRRVQGVVRAK